MSMIRIVAGLAFLGIAAFAAGCAAGGFLEKKISGAHRLLGFETYADETGHHTVIRFGNGDEMTVDGETRTD